MFSRETVGKGTESRGQVSLGAAGRYVQSEEQVQSRGWRED